VSEDDFINSWIQESDMDEDTAGILLPVSFHGFVAAEERQMEMESKE
jgi:hypothetical protein